MRFSAKSRYGIRAMIDLAIYGNEGPVSARAVAERQDFSADYLEQIFRQLRRGGLVTSRRGPRGGFRLARSAESISVRDVMVCLEETINTAPCLDRTGHDGTNCPRSSACAARLLWESMERSINEMLEGTSIADIVSQARSRNADRPLHNVTFEI
jgi:Rrf2 family iron-sulfur cluster assembly transcriptional regulator